MPSWVNPVPGRIQPNAEAWAGTPTFRITQVYHSGHQALDIGNGRSHTDPVSAMRAGKVVKLDVVQGIVGVDHQDGYRTDYAHMVSLAVGMGAQVSQGQRLGLVDSARDVNAYPTMAPHLHLVMLRDGLPIDPSPYLNEGDDMDPIPTAEFEHQINKRTVTLRTTAALTEPGGAKLRDIPGGSTLYPTSSTEGYHSAWVYDDVPSGYVLAWFAGGDLQPFEPAEVIEPPQPEPEPEPPSQLIGRTLVGIGALLLGLGVLLAGIAAALGAVPPA